MRQRGTKSIKRIWKLEAAGGGITKPDRMRATVVTCSLVTPPAYQTEVVITKIYANYQLNGISLFSEACFLFFVPLDSSFACYYWNVLGDNMSNLNRVYGCTKSYSHAMKTIF